MSVLTCLSAGSRRRKAAPYSQSRQPDLRQCIRRLLHFPFTCLPKLFLIVSVSCSCLDLSGQFSHHSPALFPLISVCVVCYLCETCYARSKPPGCLRCCSERFHPIGSDLIGRLSRWIKDIIYGTHTINYPFKALCIYSIGFSVIERSSAIA